MDLSTLEIFAELSIGIIGFSGVVSALGKSRLQVEERAIRIRALLFYSATSFFGSLLPIIADSFEIDFSTVLRVSTTALVLAISGILIWVARQVRILTPEGKFPIVLSGAIVTLGVLVVILLISGLLFFQTSIYSIYTLGIFWLLAMAVFHFCILVVSIQIPDEGT